MTREEKLFSMTMKVLAGEAEKLGVKINKKGKKEDAVKRILDAEAAITENPAEAVKEVTEADIKAALAAAIDAMYTIPIPEEVIEEPAPKKEHKPRTVKTFETVLADIPLLSRVTVRPNGKKRNAVHVYSEDGKKHIFGYGVACLIVYRHEYVGDIPAEECNYGWRVEPTRENMIAIQHNYLATLQ